MPLLTSLLNHKWNSLVSLFNMMLSNFSSLEDPHMESLYMKIFLGSLPPGLYLLPKLTQYIPILPSLLIHHRNNLIPLVSCLFYNIFSLGVSSHRGYPKKLKELTPLSTQPPPGTIHYMKLLSSLFTNNQHNLVPLVNMLSSNIFILGDSRWGYFLKTIQGSPLLDHILPLGRKIIYHFCIHY